MFFVSLILSAVVHALVLGARVRGPPAPTVPPIPAGPRATTSRGMRAVRIAPPSATAVPGSAPIRVEEPDLTGSPSSGRDRPIPTDAAEAPPDHGPTTPSSPLERLRPHAGDPRLWGERRARPDASAGTIQLLREIDAYHALRVGVPTVDDWTYATWVGNDDVGGRWGAAPGVIFLGGTAIPICREGADASDCGFGLPPIRREEYRRRLRALVEIGRQRAWGEIRDRADSIRRRRNAERDSVIRR